jgi:hypothetical protein
MGDYFALMSGDEMYEATTVILATGVEYGKPIKGEEEFLGKGVGYCATCDAPLYKDKKVYEHEQEWRMLYYNIEDENDYVSIPDMGCLKAIYYGPDITSEDKVELHEIATKKGIEEYDVCLDTNSRKYDLKITPFI